MRLEMDMLWGRAVTEQRGASVLVKNFNVKTLSPDVKTRFKQHVVFTTVMHAI
jgi:hypothetical protein